MMKKAIVVGGGFAGVSAAINAKKEGVDVILIERTDKLGGLGNVGGIVRNNGRYSATEEAIMIGLGDIFNITDKISHFKNINFPNHNHASLYNVHLLDKTLKEYLYENNIEVKLQSRVIDLEMNNKSISSLTLSNKEKVHGDVFIDTTGTTGSMGNCRMYGNGCVMCILRCPTFGPRVSITELTGQKELISKKEDGSIGAFSGSCKLRMDSIDMSYQLKLKNEGKVIIKLDKDMVDIEKLKTKICQQYSSKDFAENIILLNTGSAKLMSPYIPLEKLRSIKGFESAIYEDPYAGGNGNSIRFLGTSKRDNNLKVNNIDNLYCAGEKSGFYVGHTEAICTGAVAGRNSARIAKGKKIYNLPENSIIGDFISYFNKLIEKGEYSTKLTFAGSTYFDRMKEKGWYTVDKSKIIDRLKKEDIYNIYS